MAAVAQGGGCYSGLLKRARRHRGGGIGTTRHVYSYVNHELKGDRASSFNSCLLDTEKQYHMQNTKLRDCSPIRERPGNIKIPD